MRLYDICRSGDLSRLQKHQQQILGTTDAFTFVLSYVVQFDQFEMFKWLLTATKKTGDSAKDQVNGLIFSARHGRLPFIKWLIEESMVARQEAARNSGIDFSGPVVDISAEQNRAVRAAAKYGHLDIVKWLVKEATPALRHAAENVGVDFHETFVDVTAEQNYAIRAAAENGHLNVIKWLVLESGQPVDVTALENTAVQRASENGHLDVVKWLVKESFAASQEAARKFGFEFSGKPVDVTDTDNYALRLATLRKQLHIINWLIKESGQPVDVTRALAYADEDTGPILQAVVRCHSEGITIQQIQTHPVLLELAESGMNPKMLMSLSSEDLKQLTNAKEVKKSKSLQL